MKKKILSVLLLMASIFQMNAYAAFSDISASKAKKEIEAMADRGIIKGTSETTFSPNANVTRAEFAAMLTRAFNVEETQYNNQFTDVSADDWFAKEVGAMAKLGIINGYEDKTFRPHQNISNEEAQKLLVCAFEAYAEPIAAPLSYASFLYDYTEISKWATDYIGKAEMLGCLVYEQGEGKVIKMYPKRACTREDAALGIYRIIGAVESYNERVYAEEE